MSINSLLPIFKLSPASCKNVFFILLNWFLTLNISEMSVFWSFLERFISLINFSNSFNFLSSKPLNTILPPSITSSPDVSNSSILPINLFQAGLLALIPETFDMLYNVLSISIIISLAETCPAASSPSTRFIPSNKNWSFLPAGEKGSTIYLAIHWSNWSSLYFKSLPASAILLPILLKPYAIGTDTSAPSAPNLNLLYNFLNASSVAVSRCSLSSAEGPPNQSPQVPISSTSATSDAPPDPPNVTAAKFCFPVSLDISFALSPALTASGLALTTLFTLAAFANLL